LDHVIDPADGGNGIGNQELYDLFQRPIITKEISVRRLEWAVHAWWKQGSIIRTVIENSLGVDLA